MKQKHAMLAQKEMDKGIHNEAFIDATIKYRMELDDRKEAEERKAVRINKSAKSICDEINRTYDTKINDSTVRKYVQKGKVGVVMGSQGRKGTINQHYFSALCGAVETYVSLIQLDGKIELSFPRLSKTVNAVINTRLDEQRRGQDLLDRIRSKVSISFEVGK